MARRKCTPLAAVHWLGLAAQCSHSRYCNDHQMRKCPDQTGHGSTESTTTKYQQSCQIGIHTRPHRITPSASLPRRTPPATPLPLLSARPPPPALAPFPLPAPLLAPAPPVQTSPVHDTLHSRSFTRWRRGGAYGGSLGADVLLAGLILLHTHPNALSGHRNAVPHHLDQRQNGATGQQS